MHIDSHGRKIINYILDVDECVDFKLLSIVPLLCSHLVYLNVNQQTKNEKLEVISKKQTGLLEIFAYFMDIVQLDNLFGRPGEYDHELANDLESRTL